MFTLLLFFFLWFIFGVFVWRNHVRQIRAHKLPPVYQGGLPIIGHIHYLIGKMSNIWPILQDLAKACVNHGGIIYFKIGPAIIYVITDPEHTLTVANACLEKHFVYKFAKNWLGDGLIISPVEIWKRHRKLLLPAFSLPVVNTFIGVFNEQAKKLTRQVENHVGEGQFDCVEVLRSIALETICLTGFGINGVEDEDFVHKYMSAVDAMLCHMMVRIQSPWLYNDLIYRLSGHMSKENELLETLRQMSEEVIQRKRKVIKNERNKSYNSKFNGLKYQPFLDLLLDLSSNGSLSDKEIFEELDTAIVAGFDTTSNTLVSVLVMLGAYPEVQQRVYDEIVEAIPIERDVDKDDIKKLIYLEAVLLETMRMFPTAPVLPREVPTDLKLKNYTLRAGSSCLIFPAGMHIDHCWGDRFQFRPERWLDPETIPKNSFAGFSVGKRNCIGKTYAMIAMKISMVHFLRRYKIKASEKNLQFRIHLMLKAKGTIAIENRV